MEFDINEVIKIPKWIIALLIPALVSGIMTYGIFTAKQATLNEKITRIEAIQKETVSKSENLLMLQNLQIQLDNIKSGIDKLDKKVEEHMNNDKR